MMTIPVYRLSFKPEDLFELKRDVWIDEPVSAKLSINKRKFNIDIAYRGSHIREFVKKSYHIQFDHPSVYKGAKEVHLNAEYKDPSLIRNKLSLDFFSDIGCLSPQSQHVFLILNGEAHGVYLELESVDEHFLARRKISSGSIYYAINGNGNFSLLSGITKGVKNSLVSGYQKKFATYQDDRMLEEMIFKINTMTALEFEKGIVKIVDVDKYLRWLAGVVLTQNYDGFVHNYALYRNRKTGRFEIIPWDYDATWGRDVNGKLLAHDYVPIEGFNTLTARILNIASFRKQYQLLLSRLLEFQYTVEHLQPRVEKLTNGIRPFIEKDPYKKSELAQFDREPDVIYNFISNRSKFIKNQLYKLD